MDLAMANLPVWQNEHRARFDCHRPLRTGRTVDAKRRHMTASQRAMATAVIYPDPEKEKSGRGKKALSEKGVSTSLIAKARAVLGSEFVTPILEGTESLNEAYDAVRLRAGKISNESIRLAKLREVRPDLAERVTHEGRDLEGRRQGDAGTGGCVMLIADIIIGERCRKDYGDLAGLAASIVEVGLLHPVVVDTANRLIAGDRRIKAYQSLGWADIPTTVVDLAEIVKGEFAENAQRKDFTPTEWVAITEAIKPVIDAIKAEAAQAKVEAGKQHGRGRPKKDEGNALKLLSEEKPTHEELLALDVAQWAGDDCMMYLWVTNNFMTRGCDLMAKWGWQHKTVLTWVKPRIGLGSYFRNTTEHVLVGVRGSAKTRRDDLPTHFESPTTGHSIKPEKFYEIVRAGDRDRGHQAGA
jgi:hypothetical protein